MNVLMISPGYPEEMIHFTRGLAEAGAQVIGVGDQHEGAMDPVARKSLAAYLRVETLWDEDALAAELKNKLRDVRIDRIECLWEPGMLVAARLREELGVPGMTVAQTIPFRDKEKMKQALDAAGIRTPKHYRAGTAAAVREAASRVGYPAIVKPIAGAGSADTYRVDDAAALEEVLPKLRHVEEVSVEEFIDGEEFTFDTICADEEILYWNISWYRPRPLIGRTVQWISPQTVIHRLVATAGGPTAAADDVAESVTPGVTKVRSFASFTAARNGMRLNRFIATTSHPEVCAIVSIRKARE